MRPNLLRKAWLLALLPSAAFVALSIGGAALEHQVRDVRGEQGLEVTIRWGLIGLSVLLALSFVLGWVFFCSEKDTNRQVLKAVAAGFAIAALNLGIAFVGCNVVGLGTVSVFSSQ